MSDPPIRPYERLPAAFHPWDPRTMDVAREVARLIASARPGTVTEHVGSSAVAGLPGKNIVDLGIEADPDEIPPLVEALRSLGFQPQGGLAPFPPTRPMLIGAVFRDGETVRIHCHVMPPARRELAEQLAFREALRADAAFRDAYAEAKQKIVTAAPDGDANQLYTVHKSGFVQDALYRLGIRRVPAGAPEPLPSGSTIGVLGGGERSRMLGLAAHALGYRLVALDPDPDCRAAAVADGIIVGQSDDTVAARHLASVSDVVTWELEGVSLEAAEAAGEIAPMRPGLAVLRVTRDPLATWRFLRDLGENGTPWPEVGGGPEAEAALTVVCARGRDGRPLAYPVPGVHPVVAHDAAETADWIARGLDLVGVLTVELAQLRGGGLMVNRLAAGVSGSGSWTDEGPPTSPFEQHVRAIAGLPLGTVRPREDPRE